MVWGSVTLLQGLRVEGWAERTGYSATQITPNDPCRLSSSERNIVQEADRISILDRLHSTHVSNLHIGEIRLSSCL